MYFIVRDKEPPAYGGPMENHLRPSACAAGHPGSVSKRLIEEAEAEGRTHVIPPECCAECKRASATAVPVAAAAL
jgi:hypothetical protein